MTLLRRGGGGGLFFFWGGLGTFFIKEGGGGGSVICHLWMDRQAYKSRHGALLTSQSLQLTCTKCSNISAKI